VAAVLFAWWPLLDFDFTFPDYRLVREVRGGSFVEHLREHAVEPLTGASDETPWRPGLHALADVAGAIARPPDAVGAPPPTPAPRRWFEVVLGLHAFVAVALFLVLVAEGAGPWFAAAGTLVAALAPQLAPVVGAPSTAFATLPCALFVLWTGRALLQWLQGGRAAWLFAALLLFVYSFAFGEAGAALPLVLLAGLAVLGKSRFRGVGAVALAFLLLGAATVAYGRFALRLDAASLALAPRLPLAARDAKELVCGLVGVDPGVPAAAGAAPWVVAAAGLAWLALLVSGRSRTRFYLAWAPLAALPFVGRSPLPPLGPAVLLPLAIGLALWLEDRVRERGPALRALALAPLVALAAWHGVRLPAALAQARGRGEDASGALESLRDRDFGGVIALDVQGGPAGMEDGLGDLIALYVRGAGGARPEVRELGLVRRPPLLLHADPLFGTDLTGVRHYLWDAGARRLVFTTREELLGGLTPMPRFAVRQEIRIVADADAARREIAAQPRDLLRVALLRAEPSPPFVATPGSRGTVRALSSPGSELVELAVEAPGDAFVVLHVAPGEPIDGRAWVDGAEVPLVDADGDFVALRVAAGKHRVHFRVARPDRR